MQSENQGCETSYSTTGLIQNYTGLLIQLIYKISLKVKGSGVLQFSNHRSVGDCIYHWLIS